jgi:protein TonB
MPRTLFDDVSQPSGTVGNRMWLTVPLTMLLQASGVVALVIAPLMATGALPSLSSTLTMVSVAPPPPPPPPPPAADTPPPPARDSNPNAAPVTAPSEVTPETGLETIEPASGIDGGLGHIVAGEIVTGIPEPPPPPPTPAAPVRVGGHIRPPAKVRHVNPVYPQLAQTAGVQGTVIVEATIGTDGAVTGARVLRSIPLLDTAALDAVRQWQFSPTLLNGVPVSVIMTVTVTFTLR